MNFRISLFYALVAILSVVFATYVFVVEKTKLTLFLLLLAVFFIFLFIFAFFKRKILLFICVLFLIISLPFISIYHKSVLLSKNLAFDNQTVTICGEITDIHNSQNSINLYLKDVSCSNKSSILKINGKILVNLYRENLEISKIKVGNKITINAAVDFYSLQDKELKKSVSFISRDIVGYCHAYHYNVSIEENNFYDLKTGLKNKIYSIFGETKNSFAVIGYAMLFGDANILDNEIKAVFTDSGTLHLFAVSGLHVSLIVLLLSFVLDKIKSKKCIKLAIIVLFLLFYCYICDFSVSIIRASFMSIFSLYAASRHKESDQLSLLSLIGLILLLITPMHLFDISFVLSFTAVLSIILLKPIFYRLFSKLFYDKISSLLSLTLSVSIGLTLVELYYFGKVSVLSFLSNLITVPLASFLFIFLFFVVIINLIVPFTSFLIEIFAYFSRFIVGINNFILQGCLFITTQKVNEAILTISIVNMFIISDYVFLKKRYKFCISAVLLGLMAILFIF